MIHSRLPDTEQGASLISNVDYRSFTTENVAVCNFGNPLYALTLVHDLVHASEFEVTKSDPPSLDSKKWN